MSTAPASATRSSSSSASLRRGLTEGPGAEMGEAGREPDHGVVGHVEVRAGDVDGAGAVVDAVECQHHRGAHLPALRDRPLEARGVGLRQALRLVERDPELAAQHAPEHAPLHGRRDVSVAMVDAEHREVGVDVDEAGGCCGHEERSG